MTTPTPRWTAETEELVARAWLASVDPPDERLTWESVLPATRDAYLAIARTALTALADAGVLKEVGGETRQEWGVLHETFGVDGPVVARTKREDNNEALARRMSVAASLKLVRRSVHVGPWREVTDDPA